MITFTHPHHNNPTQVTEFKKINSFKMGNIGVGVIILLFLNVHANYIPVEENEKTFISNSIIEDDYRGTTENEIPVFPSTTLRTKKLSLSGIIENDNSLAKLLKRKTNEKSKKNSRLLKFLHQFRLDFSKFDSTCIKRFGRGVTAPPVPHAHVFKYTRRRNRGGSKNRYGMVLYECDEGYAFPSTSADRMFCSRNKWVGPTPVCLPQGSLHESECSKCEQICSVDEDIVSCSCYNGYEMSASSCVDVDECERDNGGCFGICFNTPGSFQCSCPQGYQVGPDGKKCIDRNECLLRNGHGPCQDSCENTVGGYICSCDRIPGTKLAVDKHSCEDINECEENNFSCSHTCLNTFGNAFCSCPKGLTLSTADYKTCLPISLSEAQNLLLSPEEVDTTSASKQEVLSSGIECPPGSEPDRENPQICIEHEDCNVDNGGCEHTCVPSGSFRFCSCSSGYELLNETSCVDLNECEQENGGCDQECINEPGSYFCACKNGYKLGKDKRTCEAEHCEEALPEIQHSSWHCELNGAQVSNLEKAQVGTSCTLKCHPAFSISTPIIHPNSFYQYEIIMRDEPTVFETSKTVQIQCGAEGRWSNLKTVPSCEPSKCQKLENIENGSFYPEECYGEEGVGLNFQCLIICGEGYYPKNGRIRTCSRGLRWFPESNPLCIKLPPTPRPYIHCPSDLVTDLKPGQSSAYVRIPQPQANMDWYRYVEAEPPWAKSLEKEVGAGITQIIFTARSPISNDSATCHFKIHVLDREAPRVQGCPTSFEIRLGPGETSKEVWWSEPKFSDNVKLHYVQQSHSPGQTLSKGSYHVTYVAGDAESNKARCAFTITVHSSDEYEMADYSFYSNSVTGGRHLVVCPNLKTGRWSIHYAYYLPPGCRYQSQGLFSKIFSKFNTLQNYSSAPTSRVNRRELASRLVSRRY